jgi:carboxypeptidase D
MRLFTTSSSRWRRKSPGYAAMALLGLLSSMPAALADKTAADYFVHSLPGAPEGQPLLKMHAGYARVTHVVRTCC